ncbi:MAG TPA: F0F1 ATP synthase subunit gamma [Candidatus Saccharimonadales bacterium]|nr:F0F1 ATP synthase subunit gamma [Candidatus Saccharimonadales bacterium]
MRKTNVIQQDSQQIGTVEDLTAVFETIASTEVAKTKDKVQLSKDFFQLLWRLYTSLRVDPGSRLTSREEKGNSRAVYVIIAAQAGLSGDIDTRLIETMLEHYDSTTTDIVVIGAHGAQQLEQRGIPFVRYFQVPESESYIDVGPVIDAIADYSKITLYYEEYVSLGVQGIKSFDLISSIQEMGQEVSEDQSRNYITAQDTIFEPSLDEIADMMERTMMNLALSQSILESSLAQNASRFNAMAVAKKRAYELLQYYKLEYHRSKRADADRRSREIVVGIKKKKKIKDHA